jgi:hypothetical protein
MTRQKLKTVETFKSFWESDWCYKQTVEWKRSSNECSNEWKKLEEALWDHFGQIKTNYNNRIIIIGELT